MPRAYACSVSRGPSKPRKRVPSNAELDNDPSLRWAPAYHRMEAVYSESHQTVVRFGAYNADGTVSLLNLVGGPLAGTYRLETVRRVSAH
jgi:hypothetical protein